MFEATLQECSIFKKIVESIKDLVNDVNIETSATGSFLGLKLIGISLQAMDSSHVALVSLNLQAEGFQNYRSDKPLTLGMHPFLLYPFSH